MSTTRSMRTAMSSLEPPSPAPEPLWTVADVASFLQVSRSWVYQRVAGDEIPHLRFAGHVRFEPDAVRAFVRQGASVASP